MAAYYCWYGILRSPSGVLRNCLQSISLTFCCRKVQRGLPVIVWQVNHGLSFLLVCFVFPCFDYLIDCEYHETEDVRSCSQSFAHDMQNQKQHKPYLGIPQASCITPKTRATANALTFNQSNYSKALKVQTDPLLQRSTFTMLRPQRKRGNSLENQCQK